MTTVPSNQFSAGPLVLANVDDGVALFTGYDLKPGQVRGGVVRIRNVGSERAAFVLREVQPSNGFAPGELTLTISEDEAGRSAPLYRGDLGGVPAEGLGLAPFEPGEERTFRFLAQLSVEGANPTEDRGAGAAYEWRPARPSVASIRN